MTFLTLSLLAVGVPFVVERFYLKHRFGLFSLLFWIFVAQIGLHLGAAALYRIGLSDDLAPVVAAVGGVALLTLGFTPNRIGYLDADDAGDLGIRPHYPRPLTLPHLTSMIVWWLCDRTAIRLVEI
ncbi:MAG TPA: hypothetical protein VGN98_15530 [Tianweitania sediminis]|nr:hypothetical protein [Tianweitania sediminis]